MREAMLKPMLLLAVVLTVLGMLFTWWMGSGPARAQGARPATPIQQRQVNKIISEIDGQH